MDSGQPPSATLALHRMGGGGGVTHQLLFFAQQVVDQLLLQHEEFAGAAPEGRPVADLVVARIEVAQHQVDGIQLGGLASSGGSRIHQGDAADGPMLIGPGEAGFTRG